MTGAGSNNQAELSWAAAANATRYFIYRNDIGCDAGYARVGEVNAPTTTFTDTTVVNDIDYYYVVQPVGASDGCTGPVSNCATVTPVPCQTPDTPTGLNATANGDNRIDLTWSAATGADTYNVYRAVGTCPQDSYQLIATDISGTSYSDLTASGGLDYAYVVASEDITGGCESADSNCDGAQTTGECLEAPIFDGVQSVTNPGTATCTLNLGWDAAADYCGGPVSYNVYRSTTSGFTPGPDTLIATDVATTSFSDAVALDFEVDYFYIVRSVDDSNGSEDNNTVELSDSPTGPIDTGTWEDDAGDTGDAKLVLDPEWSVDASGGNTGPKVYNTGAYGNQLCDGAATPLLQLGTNPQLSFWSRYDIEDNWDKGQVEISTDGGSQLGNGSRSTTRTTPTAAPTTATGRQAISSREPERATPSTLQPSTRGPARRPWCGGPSPPMVRSTAPAGWWTTSPSPRWTFRPRVRPGVPTCPEPSPRRARRTAPSTRAPTSPFPGARARTPPATSTASTPATTAPATAPGSTPET